MIIASPSLLSNNNRFDFVVVGAGSAGSVIAARLAEDPKAQVLLVEAGGPAQQLEAKMPVACGALQQTEVDWNLTTESSDHVFQALKNNRFPYPRGKCLGGSSVLNYMAYVRGSSKDYDTWEKEFGATGWGWKDVLPMFKKSEHVEDHTHRVETMVVDKMAHGSDGPLAVSSNPTPGGIPQAFVRGATGLGFEVGDYNNGRNEGKVSVHQQTIQQGRRCDTATAFIYNQAPKPNLTIVTNAHATNLLFDEKDARKVVGVDLVDLQADTLSTYSVRAEKEVILSSGAIGSPQLLLLSGIGPATELEALGIETRLHLPDVGKHLEDHPTVPTLFSGKGDIGSTNACRAESMPRALPSLASWFLQGQGIHATSAYDASLFFKNHQFGKSHPNWGPDGQIGIFCATGDETLWEKNFSCQPKYNFAKDMYEKHDPQGVNIITTLNHPFSTGSVTLSSKDPLAKPIINLNLLQDDRDMSRLVTQMRKVLALGETDEMQTILEGPVFPAEMLAKHQCTAANPTGAFLEEYIRHHMFPLYHATSSCKIGKVLDPELRVLGLKGCRVADASVFPTNVSGNTNAAAIMVGEKAADMIKSEYALKSTAVCTAPMPKDSQNLILAGVSLAAAAAALCVVVGVLDSRHSATK